MASDKTIGFTIALISFFIFMLGFVAKELVRVQGIDTIIMISLSDISFPMMMCGLCFAVVFTIISLFIKD
jgi:hypothetical protein